MKRKPTLLVLSFLGLALLGGLFFYTQKMTSASLETEESEGISGAYQALNFFGARTLYPNAEIPEKSFYAGWEFAQKMPKSEENDRTEIDPWESMGPHNRGGRTLTMEFNPQNPFTLWAGSASGGIWRSYTAGFGPTAWHYVETGFPILGVGTIAFPPNDSMTIYVGTGEVYNVLEGAGTGAAYRRTRGSYGMGILKSTDGGETWEHSLDWTYDQNRGVWAIKIDPTNPNIVYAGTTHGVYKSTDAGESWERVLNVLMVNDLVIHPDDPDVLVIGVGNLGSPNGGIYRSTDAGVNWDLISDNLPPSFGGKIQLNYAPSQPDVLYASIGNSLGGSNQASWLCRSEDFGANWQVVNQTDYSQWQGWFAHDVDVSPADPNQLVIVGIDVWKSTDGGQNIIQETNGGIGAPNPPIGDPGNPEFVHSDVHDVKFHPTNPNIVYVCSDGGVHFSPDAGETFQLCTGGLQNCQFYNGFSNSYQNADFCMGGLQDNGTIVWNGDLTRQVIWGGDGSWTGINPQDDQTFYASWQGLNVVRFENGGASNTGMNIPGLNFPAFIAPYVIYPGDGNIIYAGTGGVSVTTDGGDNWNLTNSGAPLDGGNSVLSMDIASENPSVVYAATAPSYIFGGTRGRFYATTTGGGVWFDRTGILPDRYPMDIHVDPTDEATVYVTFAGFGSGHVYKSTNYGQAWSDISEGLPDVPTNAVVTDPLYPDNIYVGNDLGVFVSIDGGENWQTYGDGLNTATMIFDLKISPVNRKLRAATHGNGAYQRDLIEDQVGTNDLSKIVSNIKIYPNPASDFVKVSFDLIEKEDLTIRLIDQTGKIIQTIDNEQIITEIQELNFDLTGVNSGNYFVQIIGESGILTQKLSVINKHEVYSVAPIVNRSATLLRLTIGATERNELIFKHLKNLISVIPVNQPYIINPATQIRQV